MTTRLVKMTGSNLSHSIPNFAALAGMVAARYGRDSEELGMLNSRA